MEKIMERVKDPEIMGTVYVTAGSLLGSFFSYLLQFFLGRSLSATDFGTFSALLSLAYIFSVPAGVFSTSLIKKVASLSGKEDRRTLTVLFKKLTLYSLVFMAFSFLLISFLKDWLGILLKIEHSSVVFGFAFYMSSSFLGALPASYLQGTLRYKSFGIFTAASSFIRLLLPLILVLFGYGVLGAYLGMGISIVVAYLVALVPLKKAFVSSLDFDISSHYKDLASFGLSVLFVNLGMILLNNLDILFVKNVFDPVTAGYYAGTVTLGKILLFGAGTVTLIMFPKISSLADKRQIQSAFNMFFTLQVFTALAGVLVFAGFPKIITFLFFGERFAHSIAYLSLFSVFIGLYVLVNFMIMFFLAINRTEVSYLLIFGVIAQLILLMAFHRTISQVIFVNIFVSVLLFVVLSFKYYRFSRH